MRLMLPPVPGSPIRAPSTPQYAVLRLRPIDGLTLAAAFTLATYGHPPDGDLDATLISEASLGSPGKTEGYAALEQTAELLRLMMGRPHSPERRARFAHTCVVASDWPPAGCTRLDARTVYSIPRPPRHMTT